MKTTIEIQCPSCNGCGVYQASCERGRSAVVCSTCSGTGKANYTYEQFRGRKIKEGVTRVFKNTFGYIHII